MSKRRSEHECRREKARRREEGTECRREEASTECRREEATTEYDARKCGAEPSSKAAASTQAAKDDTVKNSSVKNPTVQAKKRPPKNKTPASGAEPPKKLAKKPKRSPPGLKKADEDYVGDRVAKDFDGEIYFGTVQEVWHDKGEKLWQIKYDDSDEEDVDKKDFIGLVSLYEKEKHLDDKKGSK